MGKFKAKFNNFCNAIERLKEAIDESNQNFSKVVRDGVIQRYEFTCELAWKTTREYLLDQGYTDINSPKATMKQAYSDKLIDNQDGWISLLSDRNLTSHLYDDVTAQEIYNKIKELYLPLFVELRDKLTD